jgi:hypothetical protein
MNWEKRSYKKFNYKWFISLHGQVRDIIWNWNIRIQEHVSKKLRHNFVNIRTGKECWKIITSNSPYLNFYVSWLCDIFL